MNYTGGTVLGVSTVAAAGSVLMLPETSGSAVLTVVLMTTLLSSLLILGSTLVKMAYTKKLSK